MKISKDALRILEILARVSETSIDDISKANNLRKPNISRAIKELKKMGLISIKQKGHKKFLSLDSYELSDLLLRSISSLPPIKDFYNVLRGNRVGLIALLYRQRTVDELAAHLSLNTRTINNNLNFFLLRGIINQKINGKPLYYLRPKFKILSDLARHLIQKTKQTEIKSLFKTVLLVRVIEQDVLVKTSEYEEVEGYYPTCYNVFHKFGVNLILKDEYFWVNRKPSLEDVIVQTLKLDRDSTRGTIYVSALIYKNLNKIDLKKLRRLAVKYRLDRWIDRLLGFVKTKGKKGKGPTQPEWAEVEHVLGV